MCGENTLQPSPKTACMLYNSTVISERAQRDADLWLDCELGCDLAIYFKPYNADFR